MKDYIRKSVDETVETGLPMIRAMFIEYPDDSECWKVADQYMFGSDYLIAPVTEYGARKRSVYLPAGSWEAADSGEVITSSGEYIEADAPLDYMPVFKRVR
jgi:Alpha-glucosidases, family 31 of glycosyl hydrolases